MTHALLFSADDSLAVLLAAAIAFIAGALITRSIFSIPRILRTLRAQAYLLAEIAQKQGVDQAEIVTALHHIDHPNVRLELKKPGTKK